MEIAQLFGRNQEIEHPYMQCDILPENIFREVEPQSNLPIYRHSKVSTCTSKPANALLESPATLVEEAENVIFHITRNNKGYVAAVEQRVARPKQFICMECKQELLF